MTLVRNEKTETADTHKKFLKNYFAVLWFVVQLKLELLKLLNVSGGQDDL